MEKRCSYSALGNYHVTKHARERYEERIGNYSGSNTIQSIKADLHFSKIKKIVKKSNGTIHVFCMHSKEFIFEKKDSKLYLTTVIKRTRSENERAFKKRKKWQ